MSKQRVPLGLRKRALKKEIDKESTPHIEQIPQEEVPVTLTKKKEPKAPVPKKSKGRPSTKKGKKLVKYSMDIHPELKRAVVKAAAIYDKEVHVMWNEIIFSWFEKEQKKNPGWYKSIKVDASEL